MAVGKALGKRTMRIRSHIWCAMPGLGFVFLCLVVVGGGY